MPIQSTARLTGLEFDTMVLRGAFDFVEPKKVELLRGELRFMNPAGPLHDDLVEFLTRWSTDSTRNGEANIRVQGGFVCDDNRPEPDILWLKPRRYGKIKPTAQDVLLLIEVADSSVSGDLSEKAEIYAEACVKEYWVVDVQSARIHVMTNSDGKTYRSISIIVPPSCVAPLCLPNAILNTQQLFEVV